jgi:hypothetical protein
MFEGSGVRKCFISSNIRRVLYIVVRDKDGVPTFLLRFCRNHLYLHLIRVLGFLLCFVLFA